MLEKTDKISSIRNKSLIIIRTNRWSNEIESWAYHLLSQTKSSIVVVADESEHDLCIPNDISKIILNHEEVEKLGLFVCKDVFWTCGDYFLIAAHDRFPDFDSYWLLDDDVRINFAKIKEFFEHCESSGMDFIACSFGKRGAEWYWYNMIQWYNKEVYGCFFPLSYYSKAAASLITQRRREFTVSFLTNKMDRSLWPNDEAFTATITKEANQNCCNFNDIHPKCEQIDKFNLFELPLTEKEYRSIAADECIYHPILSGPGYVRKVMSLIDRICAEEKNKTQLTLLFNRIKRNIVQEGGRDFSDELLAIIELERKSYRYSQNNL